MKTVKGLSYKEWQNRNKQYFEALNVEKQKEARKQGYNNRGWIKVKNSWRIICKFSKEENKVMSLFDRKIARGDLLGAIDISLLEAERADEIAEIAKKELQEGRERLKEIAEQALKKYVPL